MEQNAQETTLELICIKKFRKEIRVKIPKFKICIRKTRARYALTYDRDINSHLLIQNFIDTHLINIHDGF